MKNGSFVKPFFAINKNIYLKSSRFIVVEIVTDGLKFLRSFLFS